MANSLEFYLLTNLDPAWRFVQGIPPLRRRVNRALINRAILRMPTRPNPLSTMAPYTSWESLTNRRFDSRHLPPAHAHADSVPAERVADLFLRRGDTRLCAKSTVAFQYFAQWFTDGFLRSDRSVPRDPRKNDSTHEIDLSQLYGLTPAATRQLRAGEGGRLKSQLVDGGEFPPHLCEDGKIKPEFYLLTVERFEKLSDAKRAVLFATGRDTTNLQLGFLMLNVLFLREHNRIAGLLRDEYPRWDDDRLFATARNIMIVLLLKIVIDEYINHIAPYLFRFFVDAPPPQDEPWHRQNWMAVEFNLLYRWHSLVPSRLRVGGEELPIYETVFDTELVTRQDLGSLFEEASNQPAARIGLFNTDEGLLEAELASVRQARQVELAGYNDYRALCRFPRVTRFDQISGDPQVQQALRDVYGSVDRIEFYAGIFAEDHRPNSPLPPLLGRMVGVDAFSQALTNPLLAPRVFSEKTFSPLGMEVISTTRTLSDLVHRNADDASRRYFVSMTRRDWKRE